MKRVHRISLFVLLVLAVVICSAPLAVAKGPILNNVRPYVLSSPDSAPSMTEWTFAADKVVGDHAAEYLEGMGNCSLSLGDNQIQADYARYYQTTGWVYLKGNIRARWGGDFLQAEEAEFDLSNMTGWLKQGKLFMAKPHLYVDAERLGKNKGDSYSFKNAKVTACDGDVPAWSVSTEEGEIELDGQVRLYRSTVNVRDIPAFYWPYASLPGRQSRASGFLTPHLASSDKLGLQVNLPYYLVIDEESDATFYQNYMAKRGYMQGMEFRHKDDMASKGVWKADYLRDSRTADSESEEWEDYRGDGLARPNEDRWWIRSKYDGWISDPKIKIKLDLDMASDQNFLRDFQEGPTGFDEDRDMFLDFFGRDIENKDDTIRTSVALLTRSWERFGVAAGVHYRQNFAFLNGNGEEGNDTTVQTLPELEGFAFQQTIPGTPLEVLAETKYNFFTRNKGHAGHRLRFTPMAKLPLSVGGFSFIPQAGVDYTAYNLTRHDPHGEETIVDEDGRTRTIDTDAAEEGASSRMLWNAGFTSFTQFSKVFEVGSRLKPSLENAGVSAWTRLKHSVIPRLSYEYTPTVTGQDRHPYFDEDDRIAGRNEITYSLTNVLDRRLDSVVLSPGGEAGPKPSLVSNYLDFFHFRLEQSYDQNEATRKAERDRYERRPFSDLLAELSVKPEEFLTLTSRNWYSFYMGAITESENYIKLHRDDLGEIWLGYDYQSIIDEYKRLRDDELSIIEFGAEWKASREFVLRGKYRHDFNSERDLERAISLVWIADCYSLEFTYSSKPNDNRFGLSFDIVSF